MQIETPNMKRRHKPDAGASAQWSTTGDPQTQFQDSLCTVQQESLILNLDASLRVHERAHFYGWTQGLLQNLIKHEVLICALRDGGQMSFSGDCFSLNVPDPEVISVAFLRDAPIARSLAKAWEAGHFRPIVCRVDEFIALAGSEVGREFARMQAMDLVVHGTHNAEGQIVSFFTFGCKPGEDPLRLSHVMELLVPFLHSAWIRTRMNARIGHAGTKKSPGKSPITVREQEILRWIYLGKSNFEIGAILTISPLTVKNHVQKILRKLNVVNRAQAVGKALEQRILSL